MHVYICVCVIHVIHFSYFDDYFFFICFLSYDVMPHSPLNLLIGQPGTGNDVPEALPETGINNASRRTCLVTSRLLLNTLLKLPWFSSGPVLREKKHNMLAQH